MFKWISKIVLLINGLMEGSFGITLLISPFKIYQSLKAVSPTGGSLLLAPRMYGLAALCLGLFSLLLLLRKKESDFLGMGYLIFAIFHCGMFLVQLADNPAWTYASPIHVILGPIFLILFTYKLKKVLPIKDKKDESTLETI
jgi:hypothetical protein